MRRPWGQAGTWCQATGRRRGGRTPKIPGLADARDPPAALAPDPDSIADISKGMPQLAACIPPKHLVAGRADDAGRLRGWAEMRLAQTIIQMTAGRTGIHPLDRKACVRHNLARRVSYLRKNG